MINKAPLSADMYMCKGNSVKNIGTDIFMCEMCNS